MGIILNTDDTVRFKMAISGAGDLTSPTISEIKLLGKKNGKTILVCSSGEDDGKFFYDPYEESKPLHIEKDGVSCMIENWDGFKTGTFWVEITYTDGYKASTGGVNV